ncbi:MAG: hypothetical protein M1837_005135 [Sclerophora amabilis]|nr:MAG: hypothetical protein M1837_005135 [Sclerophora amabilis]
MSSSPCSDCVSGVIHAGTPTGTVSTIHDLETYVASPPSPADARGIVVIVPDVFGWTFSNTRVLADAYASKGQFIVYVPDFMKGDRVQEKVLESMDRIMAPNSGIGAKLMIPIRGTQVLSNFAPFLYRNRVGVAQPRILQFFLALRSSQQLPIGVAGFCWGGLHAIQLTHAQYSAENGRPLVDAAFAAHPVPLKLPADIEAVSMPLSFAIGTEDLPLNMKSIKQIQTILSKKDQSKTQHEVIVYEGAKHGFAIRGNPGNEKEKQSGLQAEDQAVAWFTRWFAEASPEVLQPTLDGSH